MSRLAWLCAAAVLAFFAAGAAAREYIVDVQHPQAADENPATPDRPLKTVGKAALLAKPGDTVFVRPGVYRESVRLRQSGTAEAPITFAADPPGQAVITGADIVTGWQKVEGAEPIYRAPWPHMFVINHANGKPVEHHPADAPLWGRAEQTIADGKQLLPAAGLDELRKAWQAGAAARKPGAPVAVPPPLANLGGPFAGMFAADTAKKELYVWLADGGDPAQLARRPRHEQWDETRWRKYRYEYYRLVEDVDRQVGQVIEALRRAGQEDNTLVIFTSDHGEGLGSHRLTGKLMFYEEEAAVPLVVSWKGVTPAKRIDRGRLVSALDVLPTICDYAGVQPPPLVRGQSLRALIEKPDEPGREFVASEMAVGMGGTGRAFMIRTKKYKYMVFPGAGDERSEMLFDLESDPGEMKNLAGEAALAGELERHRQLLAQWNKTTREDKCPVKPTPAAARQKAKAKAKK